MALRAHTIEPAEGSKQDKIRVGRGNASGKGVYCGRGIKGQRARAGGKSGTFYRGIRSDILKLPKLGGFTRDSNDPEVVNVEDIAYHFESGDEVTPNKLEEKGLISTQSDGVKILATGEIDIKITVIDCDFSQSAKEKIESAGGSIN